MRILANENFPRSAVEALRDRGHDVSWVRTDAPGSSDLEVLARAVSEGRLLITFDKDFGELVYRVRATGTPGVVLSRISADSPSDVARVAVSVLESRTDWAGNFAVVQQDRLRMISLQPGTETME